MSVSYLGDDILHVTAWMVSAVVVAETIEHRLGFELVLVCDCKRQRIGERNFMIWIKCTKK